MTNCWSNFTSNLSTMYTAVNQIDQALKDLQSGSISATDFCNDETQIQNAINNLASSPIAASSAQFITGAQAAFSQITCTQGVIKNPQGNWSSVNIYPDGQYVNFSFTSGDIPGYSNNFPWLPKFNEEGSVNGGNSETWEQLTQNMPTGSTATFVYEVNGLPVTLTCTSNRNGTLSLTISGNIGAFGNAVLDNPNASAMSQFMSNY